MCETFAANTADNELMLFWKDVRRNFELLVVIDSANAFDISKVFRLPIGSVCGPVARIVLLFVLVVGV